MKTCSECRYWFEGGTPEPGAGMCCGAPPVLTLTPAGQQSSSRIITSSNGRPQPAGLPMSLQPLRPPMHGRTPHCALFEEGVFVGDQRDMGEEDDA